MGRKERGLTLLELIVALILTTILAAGATVMMITMQKSSMFTRSGGAFTQQAAFALQVMEKDLRYGLIEKNATCGAVTAETFNSPYVEADDASRVKVKNADSEIIEYFRFSSPCSWNTTNATENCFEIRRTKKKSNGAACQVLENSFRITPAVFKACDFKLGGNVITITLQGQRQNPKEVKSATREIVKKIYLTDFDEGKA
jgi:prepilin-type N-terminal cleavage/methylation domain-containing protein